MVAVCQPVIKLMIDWLIDHNCAYLRNLSTNRPTDRPTDWPITENFNRNDAYFEPSRSGNTNPIKYGKNEIKIKPKYALFRWNSKDAAQLLILGNYQAAAAAAAAAAAVVVVVTMLM